MALPRSSVARGELRLEGAERATPGPQRRALQSAWTAGIPDGEWAVYDSAIKALRATGRPFMLGGAFGLATYTGRWRNTKDLDLYVLPQDREILAEALAPASRTIFLNSNTSGTGFTARPKRTALWTYLGDGE